MHLPHHLYHIYPDISLFLFIPAAVKLIEQEDITVKGEPVIPEATQERTKNAGPIAEVHIKGLILESQTFASSHRNALNSLT